jgi:hypothetical protein
MRLGFPVIGLNVDRTLETAMNAVDARNDAELEALLEQYLDLCDDADTQITAATARRAKYAKVEEVVFNTGQEIQLCRQQGRAYVGRISSLLGVPARSDSFSSAPVGALGGVMRHG